MQELHAIIKVQPIKNSIFKDYKSLRCKYSRDNFNIYFGKWQKAKELMELEITAE